MSSGSSKASRGGKEDHYDDGTSSGVRDHTGKKLKLDIVELRECFVFESAKNEDRFQRTELSFERQLALESAKMEERFHRMEFNFNSRLDLLFEILTGSKYVPPVVEVKNPIIEESVSKNLESVKLPVQFDDVNTSEEQVYEECPGVENHFKDALPENAVECPPEHVYEDPAQESSHSYEEDKECAKMDKELDDSELQVAIQNLNRCRSIFSFSFNVGVLEARVVTSQLWTEIYFSDGFPPGPPKKPPPWSKAIIFSIILWVEHYHH